MSRLNHAFSVEYAEAYGIECAILITHFQFWIEQNQAMGRNFHDGRTWMYQTQKEIAAIYPYWSEDVVFKTIKKLEDLEILIKGNYNKKPFDRTIWYAFKNEKMFTKPSNDGMDSVKRRNGNRQTTEPIPDTKPNTKDLDDDDAGAEEKQKPQKKASALPSKVGDIEYLGPRKEKKSISSSEIYLALMKYGFSTEIIEAAIQRMRMIDSPISDFVKYMVSVCQSLEASKETVEEPEKKVEKPQKEVKFELFNWIIQFEMFKMLLDAGKTTLDNIKSELKEENVFNEWQKWRSNVRA